MSMPFQIALIGARGRTGQAISAIASAYDAVIAFSPGTRSDLAAAIEQADVVLDFSSHHITAQVIRFAVAHRKPLIVGTTGHAAVEKQRLLAEAAKIPTVWSGNYSVGVNLLFALTRRATAVLGTSYDAELVEKHHRFKVDAPSGTAARLLEIIAEEHNLSAEAPRHGRTGITGERESAEIGVHAVRGGDIVGEHTVIFAASGERMELSHAASSRAIFAHGALRAAQWIRSRNPGVYDMQDVLGLK
jgi:4-hydroxy-tetrahydrodipicolinate reductase